jgi:hypothetical protein
VGLVALYLVFWRDVLTLNYSGHAIDVLTGDLGGVGSKENSQDTQEGAEVVDLPPDAVPRPPHTFAEEMPSHSIPVHENEETPTSTASADVEGTAGEPEVAGEGQSLQEQFEKESEALGQYAVGKVLVEDQLLMLYTEKKAPEPFTGLLWTISSKWEAMLDSQRLL